MKTPVTRASFMEEWPLYAQCQANEFVPPDNVSLFCEVCGKETTWGLASSEELYALVKIGGFAVGYCCRLCEKERVTMFVRKVRGGNAPDVVQKIGQFPPQSIDIPNDLIKRLGNDVELYRNALVCRNHSFGIGALAYLRRVVENKTNELIEVVAMQAASLGVPAEQVSKIRTAKNDKISYDERLRLASEAIPSGMKPDGANPLAVIYDLLSHGMHAKEDQQCLEIADEIRDVFEYVFSRLRAEIEDRESMVAKIKKWAGNKSK